jgi:hypothetical protein
MKLFLDALVPAIWALLWLGGGWLVAASLFRLRRGETAMVGVGLGLVLQVWLANALDHVFTALMAFWLSSALVALAGIVAAAQFRAPLRFSLSVTQWATLLALTALSMSIGRGLGIFDDYQNLPTVSLMAAGDVPPHFALNPSLRFGYHYALPLRRRSCAWKYVSVERRSARFRWRCRRPGYLWATDWQAGVGRP